MHRVPLSGCQHENNEHVKSLYILIISHISRTWVSHPGQTTEKSVTFKFIGKKWMALCPRSGTRVTPLVIAPVINAVFFSFLQAENGKGEHWWRWGKTGGMGKKKLKWEEDRDGAGRQKNMIPILKRRGGEFLGNPESSFRLQVCLQLKLLDPLTLRLFCNRNLTFQMLAFHTEAPAGPSMRHTALITSVF